MNFSIPSDAETALAFNFRYYKLYPHLHPHVQRRRPSALHQYVSYEPWPGGFNNVRA